MNLDFKHFGIYSFFTDEFVNFTHEKLLLPPNHQFSPKRLADFSTGRHCAISALAQMGIMNTIIPIGEDKEPVWPEGIVGSISHCDSLTGAIVANKKDYFSLGLDIEVIGSVTTDIWDLVFTENEKQFLKSFNGKELQELSTLIFSIKEAFYKFQFPITKTFLDFLDVEVNLPSFNCVYVNSDSIPLDSFIRLNKIYFFKFNSCVISVLVPK